MEPSSLFLRLPVEIRFQIYRYVLPRSKRSKTCHNQVSLLEKAYGRGFEPFYTYVWIAGNMSLLAVNEQVRREALQVFFGSNVFNVLIDNRDPRIVISRFRDPFSGEEPPSHAGRQSRQGRSNSVSLNRHPGGVPTSQALLELRSVVQHGRELKELPKEHLALIKHVYVVVARNTFLSYRQGQPLLSSAVDSDAWQAWAGGSRQSYSAERSRLLTNAFKAFHQHFGFSNHGECIGSLLDIEITVFPCHNPWSRGCTLDEGVLGYIESATKKFGWEGKCKIRKMRPVIDSSQAINGFTDAPLPDEESDEPTI